MADEEEHEKKGLTNTGNPSKREETVPVWAVRLTRDVEALKSTVKDLKADVTRLDKGMNGMNVNLLQETVERLCILIEGEPRLGVSGLRAQYEQLTRATLAMEEERKRLKWILIGVALTGVTNAGAIIGVLVKIFGVPAP